MTVTCSTSCRVYTATPTGRPVVLLDREQGLHVFHARDVNPQTIKVGNDLGGTETLDGIRD